MDSRVYEAAYRPPSPPIPVHPPLPLPVSTPPPPLSSLPSFPTTIVDDHSPYSSSYESVSSKACAACRFRRQKCNGDCLLAPFFPAADESRFQKAHRLFGVSKMKKILEPLLPRQRAVAMATMIYESEVHAASSDTGCLDIILQLHSLIERRAAHLDHLRRSLLPSPTPALGTVIAGNGNALVSFYTQFCSIEDVADVFERMPTKDDVSWTGMLNAFMEFGLVESAVQVFDQMPERNCATYNECSFSWFFAMNACALVTDMKKSEQIHAFLIKSGCKLSAWIEAALLDMCSKCGRIHDAREMFTSLVHEENFRLAWTSLMCAYSRNGQHNEALSLFQLGIISSSVSGNEMLISVSEKVSGTGMIEMVSSPSVFPSESDTTLQQPVLISEATGISEPTFPGTIPIKCPKERAADAVQADEMVSVPKLNRISEDGVSAAVLEINSAILLSKMAATTSVSALIPGAESALEQEVLESEGNSGGTAVRIPGSDPSLTESLTVATERQ
ncbi:hypothetical protein ZIOFF_019266 [Zingiber officinale]|uniref:LOB domain-containing protein n=1 Tax=Zingiber officinale TaxID=94328 RepID=A0A8J5H779_ZINOF|nr:hypothetical protein ZIOFF_019266 [Zingiber officinale]